MGWKIWLDDVRPAPDGWIHVKTAEELIRLLYKYRVLDSKVSEISFDNDLGDGMAEGYTVLDLIERICLMPTGLGNARFFNGTTFKVHSANPVAAKRMNTVIERIYDAIDERLHGE